ncbi:hypothetical protein K1719_022980 [Acacia pycnantha]|nr:hypothetical protein K1719_022980 [Acacia pycnantha]
METFSLLKYWRAASSLPPGAPLPPSLSATTIEGCSFVLTATSSLSLLFIAYGEWEALEKQLVKIMEFWEELMKEMMTCKEFHGMVIPTKLHITQ